MSVREADLLAGAYAGGIECTLSELMLIWGKGEGELDQLLDVQFRVQELGLVLVPGPETGSFTSSRILRFPRADTLLDRIPKLTRAEGGSTEFKESLFADMKRLRATGALAENPEVTKSALKSVAAFMNAQGGTLLIGVNDLGQTCDGIVHDFGIRKCDRDRLELTLRDLVSTRLLGVDAEAHLTLEWADCGGNPVIGLDVVPSSRPCFLKSGNDFEFYIRRGNRTVSLDLPAFYEHIRRGGVV